MAKILVADDNSSIQNSAREVLKAQGHEVITVSNGEQAVQKVSDSLPDLILADIFMPGYNGYEVCAFVKKDERFANVPVILLYGKFEPLDDGEVKRVQADDVLMKPFKPPEPLLEKVNSILERMQAAQAGADKRAAVAKTHQEFAATVPTGAEEPAAAEAAEPEYVEEFPTTPQRLEFDESEKPLAFGELLDTEPVPETEPVLDEEPADASPAVEEAEAEAPSYDIREEARQPSPDEPPIPVDFSGSEGAVELVREEHATAPGVDVQKAPELVGSGEWVSEQAPEVPMDTPEPPRADFDIPTMESSRFAAPELPQEMMPPAIEPPPEKPAVEAAVEAPLLEIPPIPEPELPPASTPSGVVADELPGLEWSPEAPAEQEPAKAEAAAEAPAPTETEAPAAAFSPELIESLVAKVVANLSPKLTEDVTQEVLRRLRESTGKSGSSG